MRRMSTVAKLWLSPAVRNFLHGQNDADIELDHEYDGICNVWIKIKELLSQLFSMLPQVLSHRGFSSIWKVCTFLIPDFTGLNTVSCNIEVILFNVCSKAFCAGRSNDCLNNILVLTVTTNFWLLVQRRNSLTHQHSLRRATTSLIGTP